MVVGCWLLVVGCWLLAVGQFCSVCGSTRLVTRAFDPVAGLLALVIALLHCGPGNCMRPALIVPILVPGAVIGFLINVLGVVGQVVLHAVGQIGSLFVWHYSCLLYTSPSPR